MFVSKFGPLERLVYSAGHAVMDMHYFSSLYLYISLKLLCFLMMYIYRFCHVLFTKYGDTLNYFLALALWVSTCV